MSWEGAVSRAFAKHIRDVEDNTLRGHKFLAKARAMGRITYGASGAGTSSEGDFDWRVKFAQGQLSGLDDNETLTFERLVRHKIARLPYRGYSMTDMMTKKEKLQCNGDEAIIKKFETIGNDLIAEAEEQIHDEFYVDGEATGNSKRFHGLESVFGHGSDPSSSTNFVTTQNDTYAGLRTDLGYYGGSTISGSWPTGSATSEYDFWTPKIANWKSTGWTGTGTWASTAQSVLGGCLIHTKASKNKKGEVDTIFMNRELYRQFKDVFRSLEKIDVQRGQSSDSLVSMGFRDVINIDGCDCTEEYGVAANIFYGLNFNNLELLLLNDEKQLFMVDGPTYDIKTMAWLLSISLYGNMKLNPRSMFKGNTYN